MAVRPASLPGRITDAGDRGELILIERFTVSATNDYGEDTQAWTAYATAWAKVFRGTGQERREASQEAGSQSATFNCDWNSTLEEVRITDRISYRGDSWDIIDTAPNGNDYIEFTAVRAV